MQTYSDLLTRDYSQVNKPRLSCIVKGKEAQEIIREHFTDPDGKVGSPEVPVVASMQLGGLQPGTFTYQKGERAGETVESLRSSLLKISGLKIGDTVVDLGQGDQEVVEVQEGRKLPTGPNRRPTRLRLLNPANRPMSASCNPNTESTGS